MRRIVVIQGAAFDRILAALLAVFVTAQLANAEPSIMGPFAPDVDCAGGADAIGVTVASGGDFDGDGTPDLAYGAPCSYVGGLANVGRVWIRSGRNGHVLRRARGSQAGMAFGSAIAFVGDLNGDGADEVAVGASYYDPPDPLASQGRIRDAGAVRILTHASSLPEQRILGAEVEGNLGASLAGFFDFDGDAIPDFVIGETGARSGGKPTGAVLWVSGAQGTVLGAAYGLRRQERFGLTVANVGAADSDDVADVLVSSAKNPVGDLTNGGAVAVYSGANPDVKVVDTYGGAQKDRLGTSSGSSGDDGSFIVGSPGELVDETILEAGSVTAFSKDGTRRFSTVSDKPQAHAQFGAAVAAVGDVNNDGVADYAVSAPFHDVATGSVSEPLEDAGRVSLLSGSTGATLRVLEGKHRLMRMGRSLTGGIDLDKDGVTDTVTGNPGDSPSCRRNAGTVKVYSGRTGGLIRSFTGIRGFETRIFAAYNKNSARVASFRSGGSQRGVNASILAGGGAGELSVAVLDEHQRPRKPGSMRVAVGTGHGGTTPEVTILLARGKGSVLETFDAGFDAATYAGGLNVAAGDLDDDGQDELIVAQADSTDGNVYVHVLSSLGPNPPGTSGWRQIAAFRVFAAADQLGEKLIKANGVNVIVVALPGTRARGIAVAPVEGVPVVRVFDATGAKLVPDWVAYESSGMSGATLAWVDLKGTGVGQIVTAPRTGTAVVRVFGIDGALSSEFQVLPDTFNGGATVAGADVDCDGKQEILVVPGPGHAQEISAYEADGEPVAGFTPFAPFSTTTRTVLAGTDRFLRK